MLNLVVTVRVMKEGIVFNDALNTFYLRLYDVGHMVKDHSDTERERGREGNREKGRERKPAAATTWVTLSN